MIPSGKAAFASHSSLMSSAATGRLSIKADKFDCGVSFFSRISAIALDQFSGYQAKF
jgi:hypothetical protein